VWTLPITPHTSSRAHNGNWTLNAALATTALAVADEGPPKDTIYNYPSRVDLVASISCAPAPTIIATQMYSQATMTKMIRPPYPAGRKRRPANRLGVRRNRRLHARIELDPQWASCSDLIRASACLKLHRPAPGTVDYRVKPGQAR
jgi:hypothetical protein